MSAHCAGELARQILRRFAYSVKHEFDESPCKYWYFDCYEDAEDLIPEEIFGFERKKISQEPFPSIARVLCQQNLCHGKILSGMVSRSMVGSYGLVGIFRPRVDS